MNEILITIVTTETADGITYPVTAVRRIEFDNSDALHRWLNVCVELGSPVIESNGGVIDLQLLH